MLVDRAKSALKGALARPWVRALLVLLVLHVPWPGLGPTFASYFGHVAPALLSVWSPSSLRVEMKPAGTEDGEWSVLFDASDASIRKHTRAALDIRRTAWLPLATFIALLVAFPLRRPRRRLLIAGLGLVVLHALWLLPLLAFFGGGPTRFFTLSAPAHTLAVVAYRALISPPGMVYALPALLWFVLAWKIEPELM